MNWAITLIIEEDQLIDRRLRKVIFYILDNFNITSIWLDDIDATGIVGDRLTTMINTHGRGLVVERKDLLDLISEDGQAIELDLYLTGLYAYRFIVRDGYFVSIVGSGNRLRCDGFAGQSSLLDNRTSL